MTLEAALSFHQSIKVLELYCVCLCFVDLTIHLS
jgi:hypothetical protein